MLCPIDVWTAEEVELGVVVAPVSMQEQADEIWDGESWHCETKVGSPVVAVLIVAVYFWQKGARMVEERMNSRRQLLCWQSNVAVAVTEVGNDVETPPASDVLSPTDDVGVECSEETGGGGP